MCCKSKLLITENEKSHILKLYGLVNEQEERNKNFSIQPSLPAGFWSENLIKQNMGNFFSDLNSFLLSNSGKTYITSIDLI